MTIIHEGTVFQMNLARIDEFGNIVERKPIQVRLDVLSEDGFIEAFNILNKAWEDLKYAPNSKAD